MEENNYIEVETNNEIPDPARAKPFKTALIVGFMGFVALQLNQVLVNLIGGMAGSILGILNAVLFVVAMVIAVRRHRDIELGGFISVARGIGTAMIAAGVMIIATGVLYGISAASPDYQRKMEQEFDKQAIQMEENGMDPADIENAMRLSKMFTQPKVVVIGLTVVGGIVSLIIALIIAFSMKREPQY